jgi:hypothetical protein
MAKQARCEQCAKVDALTTFDGLPNGWITLTERIAGQYSGTVNARPVDMCSLGCLVAWSHDETGRRMGAELEPARQAQTTGE